MAGVHKISTGLTGLAVARHPHQTLRVLYNKILSTVQKMPGDAAYRKHTEQTIGERLALVKNESDVATLEKKINCGQIEEVIKQAERELSLARKMMQWRAWEPLIGQPPVNQWKWPLN